MSKLLIIDTADAVMKRKSDGKVFVTSEAQLASISQSLGIDEKIYGGIGNKPLAIMKGQKEITSTLRSALYDSSMLAMTQGVAIENGTATVYKDEKGLKVADNSGTLSVTISGTPKDDTVYVTNTGGDTVVATVSSKNVTIPVDHAEPGDLVTVRYQQDVTGEIVKLDGDKFAEAYSLEYHTIGYDPTTNKVVKDIYIQLDHVVPGGDFEMSFENGTAIAPEITFEAMAAPNSTAIGRVVEVERDGGATRP